MLGIARRIVAGSLLVLLGWWLFSAQLSAASGQPLLGIVLAAAFGGAAVGVFASLPWGRVLGLALAGILGVASLWMAAEGLRNPLPPYLFSAADAARWYVVQPVGYAVAILCGLAVLLLLLPFHRSDATP